MFVTITPTTLQAVCLTIALVLTLTGVWVQWNLHGYCMSTEEAMKDGKLTQAQAARRVRVIKNGGHILTFIGMGLLIFGMTLDN